jgi:hypothetical protein
MSLKKSVGSFMRLIRLLIIAFALAAGSAGPAWAGPPMAFKDAFMLMGEASSQSKDWMLNYALTSRDAFGIGYHAWKSDNGALRIEHSGVNYTRLVRRWNQEHSQANLWFVLDAGQFKRNRESGRTGWMPSVQFDWETTRLYALLAASSLRASGAQYDTYKAQAGFSFYEAQFDEWQPWAVLEVKRMPGLNDKVEVTPFLRLIHKSLYLEVGATTEGKPRIGLMRVFYL